MKVILFATPDFAIPTLKLLHNSQHEIIAVYTKPAKPQGRGMQLKNTPIFEEATKLGLPVFTPKTLKNPDEWEKLKDFNADIFVVVAYGLILPKEVLNIAKFGCVNIHPSLLPRWRGSAPLQRAIMEGDKKTGVCVMMLNEGIDDGDILVCKTVDITENTDIESLHDTLSVDGAKLMLDCLNDIEKQGKINATKQATTGITYANKIEKEEGKINFNDSVEKIDRLIRALGTITGTYFEYNNERIKIIKASIRQSLNNNEKQLQNGEIIANKNELFIKCSNGLLYPLILQREGKKALKVEEFIKGFKK